MKVLTVRGRDSSGKSTFISAGVSTLLNVSRRAEPAEKPRVLVVSDTHHRATRVARSILEFTESLGFTGCRTGEHSDFQLEVVGVDALPSILSQRITYVVVDSEKWDGCTEWAKRNYKNIDQLVVAENRQHLNMEM